MITMIILPDTFLNLFLILHPHWTNYSAENDLVIIEELEVRQRLIYYNLTYRIYLWQNIFIARPF